MRHLIQTTLSVTCVFLLSDASGAASFSYQGANYTSVSGTQFTTNDSLSGTMTVNSPPAPGICTGLGNGPGQCDITELTLSSTGTPPVSLDLNTYDAGISSPNLWSLTFDGSGDLTDWNVILLSSTADPVIGTETMSLIVGSGSLASSTSTSSMATTDINNPGVWTRVVPEPNTLVLCLGIVLPLVGSLRRR